MYRSVGMGIFLTGARSFGINKAEFVLTQKGTGSLAQDIFAFLVLAQILAREIRVAQTQRAGRPADVGRIELGRNHAAAVGALQAVDAVKNLLMQGVDAPVEIAWLFALEPLEVAPQFGLLRAGFLEYERITRVQMCGPVLLNISVILYYIYGIFNRGAFRNHHLEPCD
jgi:hypothetical protein